LVLLSWIQVQQPTSENVSLSGATKKEMNRTEMCINSATGETNGEEYGKVYI
jgi:hypothetical protein